MKSSGIFLENCNSILLSLRVLNFFDPFSTLMRQNVQQHRTEVKGDDLEEAQKQIEVFTLLIAGDLPT